VGGGRTNGLKKILLYFVGAQELKMMAKGITAQKRE
jgi:hypothetical protein